MIIISRTRDGTQIRTSTDAYPPAGATTAGFVLFASLAALLAMGYAAREWWDLGGGFGFPSDAAWTRAVFAKRLAEGQGLCFNPGAAVAGAPAPAWLGFLAGGGYLLSDFIAAAKLLGIWAVVCTAYLVWMITLNLLADWRFAFLAALATVTAPRFLTAGLGGTEAPLAALLLAATIHWQAASWDGPRRQRLVLILAAAFAALCRPELGLLLPLLFLDRLLMAALKGPRGTRLHMILLRAAPELFGSALLLAPYVIYNWQAGGPLWQQPDLALRGQTTFGWALAALRDWWETNPMLFCAAVVGLPVATAAAVRAPRPPVARRGGQHSSLLLALGPLAFLVLPGLMWQDASASNGVYSAGYLTPVIAVLGSAGLFFIHRLGRVAIARFPARVLRFSFAAGIGAAACALAAFCWSGHRQAWGQYGRAVSKVSELQGAIGRYAADYLPPDASIASREVGAIGFYSGRRVVDLGGTIDQAGLRALRRPGSPDANLLAYLNRVKPSHLAIREADFPDLSQRADLLEPMRLPFRAPDGVRGGTTTMTLYETPWPPPSIRAARAAGSL